jgi:Mitochondrial degradasome RNA helicase subunit C terminal/Suv3 C-terminal domain 1
MTGVVTRHFGSTVAFAEQLQKYLFHSDKESYMAVVDRLIERRAAIDTASSDWEPLTGLATLFSVFHQRATMDGSGVYFLCDMEDVLELATSLSDVHPMRFRDRYIFCLAPVRPENGQVLSKFREYAQKFSRKGKVNLGLPTIENTTPPSTPAELLELETHHVIIDLYIWLGHRFPTAFLDMDKARVERSLCADLISSCLGDIDALSGFTSQLDLKHSRKQRKNRRR